MDDLTRYVMEYYRYFMTEKERLAYNHNRGMFKNKRLMETHGDDGMLALGRVMVEMKGM